MKLSMSDNVFHTTALATLEIKSMNFFFLKRFTCKKSRELKLIIFQNKARQQTTIMKNKTHRGPTAR